MRIYTCRDRTEDMMSAVYAAWEYALTAGHENVMLKVLPIYQQTLFDEYVHVDLNMENAQKVFRSIRNKISSRAYDNVVYASLSIEEDKLQAIYAYLRLGFKEGAKVDSMLTEPCVMRILELRRRVGNEAHYSREFARFTSINNRVYVCHMSPKNNITPVMGIHFADRMPSENWMIIDDNRKTAVVHPKDLENYIKYLTDEEFEKLSSTEDYEDEYTELWRIFFKSIGIKERENKKLQQNMFPLWMRKHAVEFKR